MVPPIKAATAVRRGQENAQTVEAALRELRHRKGEAAGFAPGGFALPQGVTRALHEVLLREGAACGVPPRLSPPHARQSHAPQRHASPRGAGCAALSGGRARAVRAAFEADGAVAGECARLGAVGVLSNDSDFLCMGVPLLPLAETSLDDGVLRATRYAPAAVAAALALPPARLPWLACLVGNDHIDRARLAAFHARLVPAAPGRRAAAVVRAVARVLAGAGAGPAAALGEAEELALVRDMFAAEERAEGAAAEARLLTELRAARAHYERPARAAAAAAEAP